MEASRWTNAQLDDLESRFDKVLARIDGQSERIDKLQHTIVVVGGGLFAAFVAFLAAILGLIVTLLVMHA